MEQPFNIANWRCNEFSIKMRKSIYHNKNSSVTRFNKTKQQQQAEKTKIVYQATDNLGSFTQTVWQDFSHNQSS